jgi:hypothetical protein
MTNDDIQMSNEARSTKSEIGSAPEDTSYIHVSRSLIISFQPFLEIFCVFLLFALQGAWPLPDTNEPNYLGKAVHFWNPDWAKGDFFLETADTHATFYWTFGWLSLWLSLPALAWTGRVITWASLAWGWQRLSTAVVPRRWFSVLSAGLVAGLIERFNMAGEWVFGGVEGKGFAYALVFFALAAIVNNRWNRGWILLGAASAFHVLVGGWMTLAVGLAWLMLGRQRPRLVSMLPGLVVGLLLSLPGLIPALLANQGASQAIIDQANVYYVYFRLWHHLDLLQIAWNTPHFVARLVLLCIVWVWLCRKMSNEPRLRLLSEMVNAVLLIVVAGLAIDLLQFYDEALAARLLRFYWFRMSDVVVPMGVALAGTWLVAQSVASDPRRGLRWLAVVAAMVVFHVGALSERRVEGVMSYTDQGGSNPAWRKACQWVVESDVIEPNARFITPMISQTFKWYTGRPEVGNFKEVPQDAASIVVWLDRLKDIFARDTTTAQTPDEQWYRSLADRDPKDIRRLAAKYGADYVLTFCDPLLPLPVVYKNAYYVIYKMDHAP